MRAARIRDRPEEERAGNSYSSSSSPRQCPEGIAGGSTDSASMFHRLVDLIPVVARPNRTSDVDAGRSRRDFDAPMRLAPNVQISKSRASA